MVDRSAPNRRQLDTSWATLFRIAGKVTLLFLLLNVCFALSGPLDLLGQASLYNSLFPGRDRLPYGDPRSAAYNLSLNNIPAMLHSHKFAQPAAVDELRILVIGDSSVWGWLLEPEESLANQLTARAAVRGTNARYYNLGYPVLSAAKDLALLEVALAFEPDLVVWPITLASLVPENQLNHPVLQENSERVRALITRYDLALNPDDPRLRDATFWQDSIVGRRRDLADLLRLQLLAPIWFATERDQLWPETTARQSHVESDLSWESYEEPATLMAGDLTFDVLRAGAIVSGDVPVLFINEPIYVSDGENSDLRYNSFYPRWAYDQYRLLLAETADEAAWHYQDLWNAVPADEFTDTPVHLTEAGTKQLAARIEEVIERYSLLHRE